jgi:hypothetical protein
MADKSSGERIVPVYPGKSWETAPASEVGMDSERLHSVVFGQAGCIIRYGYMVHTWGDLTDRSAGGSDIKPVFSHFLLKAVEEGLVPSIDAKVVDFEPRLASLNADLGHKDRDIAWVHMANQVACYGTQERPGTVFDYNDLNMALFGDTVFFKIYGATSWDDANEKVVVPKLTGPMQCEDHPAGFDHHGRLPFSVRDHCRFGLLYLRKGRWGDQQLISPEHADMAVNSNLPGWFPRSQGVRSEVIPNQRTMGDFGGGINQTAHCGSYSFAWWTNGTNREGVRRMPDAPPNLYGCEGGSWTHFSGMYVMPSSELIVCWHSAPRTDAPIDTSLSYEELSHMVADYTAQTLNHFLAGVVATIKE